MKKIYVIPVLQVTELGCETLIAESLNKFSSGADEDVVLVKGERSTREDYNVWNEDWSK